MPSIAVQALTNLGSIAEGDKVIGERVDGTTVRMTFNGTNITGLGTVTSGTWNATLISVPYGGSGRASATAYAPIIGGTTSTGAHQSMASAGSAGQIMRSAGASAVPTWSTATFADTYSAGTLLGATTSNTVIALSDIPTAITIGGAYVYRGGGTDVSVADGGTGVSSATAYSLLCGGTTSTGAFQSVASVGTSGQILQSNGAGALPSWTTFSASGVTDGDKGDITTASSGTVWTIDTPSSVTLASDDKILLKDTSASNVMGYATAISIRDLKTAKLTSFHVTLSGNQTVTSNVVTKVQNNTETFDTGAYYDNATNHRFTPLIAGKYIFSACLYGTTTSNDGICNAFIYKNGTEVSKSFAQYSSTATLQATTSIVLIMNGSTDYVEMYGQVTGTTFNSSYTSFSGCLLELT